MTAVEDSVGRIAEEHVRSQIRDAAIDQVGRHGFRTPVKTIAYAAGVSAEVVLDMFGSKAALLRACDDYIAESVRTSKSAALQSMSPASWFAQLSAIEDFAPMMTYLVRSLQDGGRLGQTLLRKMIDNAVGYMEDGVRAGTIKPSRDPKARATFLAINNAGGFLLYLRMHPMPSDMAAVLRDYTRDMILPALEIYTHGLMVDSTMEEAFVAEHSAASSS
jgi:AcrR family transcriptional regulator